MKNDIQNQGKDNDKLLEFPESEANVKNNDEEEYMVSIYNKLLGQRRNIMDVIVENIRFSRFHLATFFVCLFSMMCDGYSSAHFRMSEILFMKKYSWLNRDYSTVFVLQMLGASFGAFVSANSTTGDWDVFSNLWIGLIGFLSIILINLYTESAIYFFLIVIFFICHGFIANICTNFLLELFKQRIREPAFMFVSSFRVVGMALFGMIVSNVYDTNHNEDPCVLLVGLAGTQFMLSVSLLYFFDSPRVLFYNNSLQSVYEYIQETNSRGGAVSSMHNELFRQNIIEKLRLASEEIEDAFGCQKNQGVFVTYLGLWTKIHARITIYSILFLVLSTSFLSNIRDSFYYIHTELNAEKYFFSVNEASVPHYNIAIYYSIIFVALFALLTIHFAFPGIKRIYFTISSLVICGIVMIVMMIVKNYYLYLFCIFETFAYFYFVTVYMHFSQFTTTRLRNSMTSTMYITVSLTMVFQYFFVKAMAPYTTAMISVNLGINLVLIFLEVFLVKYETNAHMLQEIELFILSSGNKIS